MGLRWYHYVNQGVRATSRDKIIDIIVRKIEGTRERPAVFRDSRKWSAGSWFEFQRGERPCGNKQGITCRNKQWKRVKTWKNKSALPDFNRI